MKEILVLIILFIGFVILWSLPLYAIVNFVCWTFHLSFHITILQSFSLCLLASLIHKLLFKKEES
jgi:hypothetical protein